MEKLVCWKLMGLRQNGAYDVWYQIETYPTAKQAEEAAGDPKIAEQGYAQTQVMPYYRVENDCVLKSDPPIQSAVGTGTDEVEKAPATAI